jgi:hypothetical protein
MAHFAQLDENNQIIQVIVVNNSDCGDLPFPESEAVGIAFCHSLFGGDTKWFQTSYNNNFRRQYAAIGGFYSVALDVFIDPQPFSSWTLNEFDGLWVPPVPKPEVPLNHMAVWDEVGQEWDIVLDVSAV